MCYLHSDWFPGINTDIIAQLDPDQRAAAPLKVNKCRNKQTNKQTNSESDEDAA